MGIDSSEVVGRGSEWRRWDPHLHAPGTLLSDQFSDDWSGYLDNIEKAAPGVSVLGVTDYYCIRAYSRVCEYQRSGRLQGVELIFPNVEMRLTIETERRKGINCHLLFSVNQPDHEKHIERILSKLTMEFRGSTYSCSLDEFERLGKTLDSHQHDTEKAIRSGANQFKVDIQQLKMLFRSETWLRRNCLVAVAAAEGDGTSGLQGDASFLAMREEIEAFADIIFSGKPADREYWLGKKADHGVDVIEKRYGRLKPCLHGSDAHRGARVLAPDLDRFCWIKAEPTFEGLRQAVIEPEQRVFVGKEAPVVAAAHQAVRSLTLSDAQWFANSRLDLNPGLIAIIGARGSGKTALADILACATDAVTGEASDASFLRRASEPTNLLAGAKVTLTWGDGEATVRDLTATPNDPFELGPRVRYLSQQFVEQLCSAEGLADALVREIEAVVFEAVDETERLEAVNFASLREIHVAPIRRRQRDLRGDVARVSRESSAEDAAHEKVPSLRAQRAENAGRIDAAKKELEKLAPKDKDERARRLSLLDSACQAAEGCVQQVKVARQKVEELRAELGRLRHEATMRLADMRQRFAGLGLRDEDWEQLAPVFSGNIAEVLDGRAAALDAEILHRMNGSAHQAIDPNAEPQSSWPVVVLRSQREAVKKEVTVDAAKLKNMTDLTKSIAQLELEAKKMDEQIAKDAGYEERRKALIQLRRADYAKVFETLQEEQALLESLYAPLRKHLADAGTASKLQFVVRRRIDIDGWVRTGEHLLDLRTAGNLRGRGALKDAVLLALVPAWKTGGADEGRNSDASVHRHPLDRHQGWAAVGDRRHRLAERRCSVAFCDRAHST